MSVFVAIFALSLVLLLPERSLAHPGAIAEGRGSCGEEFDTVGKAFHIPDIKEAWYIRRVSTCSHPFFWVNFDTTETDQKVTFVAASPEVEQFQDKLSFTAVLFGPGFSKPEKLPAELVDWEVEVPADLGWIVLTSPESFDSCDFVQNPVMSQYKQLTDGRCMEHMNMKPDFEKPALAGKTWHNWWLASHDLKIRTPGRYYVVIYVSDQTTGSIASGRIEVTLGPWSWYGYASDSTKKQAHSQTTTCSCATNHASWYTQHQDMLGYVSPSLFSSQLPFQQCSAAGGQDMSTCHASIKADKINGNTESGVEWAAIFDLNAGTYDWNYFAFKYYSEWKFPDATMDVVIVHTDGTGVADLEGVESTADLAMSASLANDPTPDTISPAGTMTVGSSSPSVFRISLPEPVDGAGTNVTFKLSVPTAGSLAIFTQHRPSEFMAEQLTCVSSCDAGSEYIFWTTAKTYGVRKNDVDESVQVTILTGNSSMSSETPSSTVAMTSVSSARSAWYLPLLTWLWLVVDGLRAFAA